MNVALSAAGFALKAMRSFPLPQDQPGGRAVKKEGRLDRVHGRAVKEGGGRLKELCREMESIFIAVLMRQMRQTVWKSDFLPDAAGEDIFRSMWEAEVAGRVEEGTGGFGIADSIYKELERQGEWRGMKTQPSVHAQASQYWSL